MTKEEAIKSFEEENRTMLENKTAYINELKARGMKFEDRMVSYIDESVERNELAISALKGGWIPIVTRPMTEEERKDFPFTGYNFIGGDEPTTFDCELPDDGEEVEVTIYGHIVVDTFYNDGVEGCYFDSVDIENVTAWRRCEPYKKGE